MHMQRERHTLFLLKWNEIKNQTKPQILSVFQIILIWIFTFNGNLFLTHSISTTKKYNNCRLNIKHVVNAQFIELKMKIYFVNRKQIKNIRSFSSQNEQWNKRECVRWYAVVSWQPNGTFSLVCKRGKLMHNYKRGLFTLCSKYFTCVFVLKLIKTQ